MCGVFGATAASAIAMGPTEHQVINAVGLAGSQASGLREARAQVPGESGFKQGRLQKAGYFLRCWHEMDLPDPRQFLKETTVFTALMPVKENMI